MRHMPHLVGVTCTTANYCQYDEWKFFKPTDFFTNFPLDLKTCDLPNRKDCHHERRSIDGVLQDIGGVRTATMDEKYAIPPSLVKSILEQAHAAADEDLTEPPHPVFRPKPVAEPVVVEAKEPEVPKSEQALQIIKAAAENCKDLPAVSELNLNVAVYTPVYHEDQAELKDADLFTALQTNYNFARGKSNLYLVGAYNTACYMEKFKATNKLRTDKAVRDLLAESGIKIHSSEHSDFKAFKKVIDNVKAYKFLYGCAATFKDIRKLLAKQVFYKAFQEFKTSNPDEFKVSFC
jgi:hypothetical protein